MVVWGILGCDWVIFVELVFFVRIYDLMWGLCIVLLLNGSYIGVGFVKMVLSKMDINILFVVIVEEIRCEQDICWWLGFKRVDVFFVD